MLKSLFGLVPRAGDVTVDGRKVRSGSTRVAIAAGIGYVPERRREEGLALELSVRDNASVLLTGGRSLLSLVDRRAEDAVVDRLVADFRLKAVSRSAPVRTLSGGNQQKIVLGRWLLHEPAVLLLDEPTRGIDVATQQEIHRLIEEAVNRGAAVVMASSELPALLDLCDRILVLRAGEVVDTFTRGIGEEELAAAMTGATLVPAGPRTRFHVPDQESHHQARRSS
jgi:ABC-type sugar transport system ATPase subunit